MSRSNKNTNINAARLKALHSIGLAKSYTSAKSLSKSQKDKVAKLTRQYENILEYRQEYIAKDVSSFSKKAQEKFKAAGYTIINNKMYIRKQGFSDVDIKWHGETGSAEVIRKIPGQSKEVEPIFKTGVEGMEWRDRLLKEYQDMGFKSGDYIAIRFYNHGVIERAIYQNIEQVYKYLERDLEIDTHRGSASKKELLDNAHLVKLSVSNQRALAAAEQERARRQKETKNKARSRRRSLGIKKPKKK